MLLPNGMEDLRPLKKDIPSHGLEGVFDIVSRQFEVLQFRKLFLKKGSGPTIRGDVNYIPSFQIGFYDWN